jgi:hypothetical protein
MRLFHNLFLLFCVSQAGLKLMSARITRVCHDAYLSFHDFFLSNFVGGVLKGTDFCMLTLYPETLLNLFITSNSFYSVFVFCYV